MWMGDGTCAGRFIESNNTMVNKKRVTDLVHELLVAIGEDKH